MSIDEKSKTAADVIGDTAKAVVNETAKEVWLWARWAGWGAVVGAVAGGGAGLYFLGLVGLGIGLVAGAIVGGIGAWVLYISMIINS